MNYVEVNDLPEEILTPLFYDLKIGACSKVFSNMIPTKVTLEQSQIDFLAQFKDLGFKDKSSVVRSALNRLRQELEREELERSADLYAEGYAEDVELQELTALAGVDWPQ